MADVFPTSYQDPMYASLDANTQSKLGLPDGLLASIRLNGEKSNADQVSSAGAKTPYQITPATRAAALDKYGIDAYLSPQNASEVAGRLLSDSLQRGQNNVPRAVAEYVGGTDPSNWGKQTNAYVARVMQGLSAQPPQGAPQPQVTGMSGQSTFDRALQSVQQQQAPSQLNAIYQAYASGQMDPQERGQYEDDVRSGKMMLPPGASLQGSPGVGGSVSLGAGTPQVPDGVMQAFANGQMTPQEYGDFEHDVRSGALALPQGMDPNALFGPPDQPKSLVDRIKAIPGNVMESITGAQRQTPTTNALPDWATMPEMNDVTSGATWKAALGTMMSDPAETAQIIKANYPGVQVNQDEKGNYILTSSVDGKQYAIKPGFQVSDIPRAAGAALAFTPAGRAESIAGAALKSGLAQAGIEGTQAATGGNFDTGNVLESAALGGGLPVVGRVLAAAAAPAKALVSRALGRADAVPEAGTQAAAATPPVSTVTSPVAPPTVADVAATAGKAASGSKQATSDLAAMTAPDAETAAAADRLGIRDYLQPDHVTSSEAYRNTVGILKSMSPTSNLSLAEKAGLENVAGKASDVIDEIGGTTDLSNLSAGLKDRMQSAHAGATAQEDALWQKTREAIPAKTEAPATSALQFLQQRADELGGAQNLTPMEKTIAAKLTPKEDETLASLSPSAKQQAIAQGAGPQQPTYALLDDVRKDVGANAKMRGPFVDADTGLAKKYYGLLSSDSEAVANAAGAGDLVQAAKAATTVRKGMEDDLASLFGKNLDQSMAPKVAGAMQAAAKGDADKVANLLQAVPEDMRQQVVASGLASTFRSAATRGEIDFTRFSKWYQNLQANGRSFTAIMSHLPPGAAQKVADLARVSKGISDSYATRIATGRLATVVKNSIEAPDTLASRMFDLAKHVGKGVAVDAVGGHGAGLALELLNAIKGNAKPSAAKAIDDVLTSPEFAQAAKAAGTTQQAQSVRTLAYSKPFTRFARALGNPRELTNREQWLLKSMQADSNMER